MLMAEDWNDLTQAEKIEDLRKDVTRIFRILTELRDAVAQDQSVFRSQIEVMKPWGPFLNRLQQRLDAIDGGGR
jgi:hypothetical protein